MIWILWFTIGENKKVCEGPSYEWARSLSPARKLLRNWVSVRKSPPRFKLDPLWPFHHFCVPATTATTSGMRILFQVCFKNYSFQALQGSLGMIMSPAHCISRQTQSSWIHCHGLGLWFFMKNPEFRAPWFIFYLTILMHANSEKIITYIVSIVAAKDWISSWSIDFLFHWACKLLKKKRERSSHRAGAW